MTDLRTRIEITYDQFQDWLNANTPAGWDFEDTNDLLCFMGYVYYQTMREELPRLTLEQCASIYFDAGDKTVLWQQIREENSKPLTS